MILCWYPLTWILFFFSTETDLHLFVTIFFCFSVGSYADAASVPSSGSFFSVLPPLSYLGVSPLFAFLAISYARRKPPQSTPRRFPWPMPSCQLLFWTLSSKPPTTRS